MVAALENRVLDNGLTVLQNESSTINICSSEPTTYAQATTTYLLGYKSFAVGSLFGAPANGTPNGRQVASNAVTDGTIVTGGTASWWAVTVANTLHAHGTLNASQVVTATNTFTLASFLIKIPAS